MANHAANPILSTIYKKTPSLFRSTYFWLFSKVQYKALRDVHIISNKWYSLIKITKGKKTSAGLFFIYLIQPSMFTYI